MLCFVANFYVLWAFRVLVHVILTTTHFTEESTEAQRSKVTQLRL